MIYIYSSTDIKNTRALFPHQRCPHREGIKTCSTECENCIVAHLVIPNSKASGRVKVKCMAAVVQRNVEMWRKVQALWRMRKEIEG